MKTNNANRTYLMTVHDANGVQNSLVLGKPLPLRDTVFGMRVIPLAEVLPEAYDPKQHFSIAAFGAMVGISRATVCREIKSGRLKAKKLGKRTVIAYEDAAAYLASLRPVDAQIDLGEDDKAAAAVKAK